MILTAAAALILSGCGTYTGEGAYMGSSIGGVLGSAIGGISGGWRGSDIGTIVGMAGGAVVGAAVGSAADKAQQDKYQQYQQQEQQRYRRQSQQRDDSYGDRRNRDSGFDPYSGGDDRIEMDNTVGQYPDRNPAKELHISHDGVYSTVAPHTIDPKSVSVEQLKGMTPEYNIRYNPMIEVRNAAFIDRDGNGVLQAGEDCQVTFEIMNNSQVEIFDIQPTVIETTGNKHIRISPSIRVESIRPGMGVRYTAYVHAGKRLKDGEAVIRVAVAQGRNDITSQMKEFRVKTERK